MQSKKIFRIHLSISVVLILFSLGTLSLVTSFYLGMIAGKSMQRPPENSVLEEKLSTENLISEEDLKFFDLSERKRGQDLLDLEGIKELKNKTNELTKITKAIPPKVTKTEVPKVVIPKNPKQDQKNFEKTNSSFSELSEPKKLNSKKQINLEKKNNAIFTIQVFASRNQKNAKNLVEKLKKDGFSNSFIFRHSAGTKTLYRVRVGEVSSDESKILANKLKKLKYIDSVRVYRL